MFARHILGRALRVTTYGNSLELKGIQVISAGSAAELAKQYEPGGRMVKIATFEELKAATTNPNILIIDVREPHELQETGVVPNSINIPLATVKDVLATSCSNDFKETYGKDKPSLDSDIIFTCRSGKRSAAAYGIAEDLGYKNLRNFDGANPINFASIRLYSGDNKLASFEEVKNLKAGTILIDVREPKELKETGVIPKSFNIPLGEVEDAFKSLSDEAFQKKYGLQKPKEDYPLVFSCRSGVRSAKAMAAVEKLGYSNVKNYKGGWLDWEEQQTKSK